MVDQREANHETPPEVVLEVAREFLTGSEPTQTILLVEDEARVRNVIRQVLEAAGYHVLEAKTATEAMETPLHQCGRRTVLITDIVLPDRSGVDLASELSRKFPGLKTVFISGYPENAITRNCPQASGGHYLAKPFSGDSLLGTLQRVLAEY